jgi:hypothetical protein
MWEAEIERMEVPGHLGKKVCETPSQQKRLSMVVHTCHSSYLGSINRIMIQVCLGKM